MNKLKVMDVTFRDGGHRVGFSFNDDDLAYVLPALDKACIDYVEVGYRNTSMPHAKTMGPSEFCPEHYLRKCRSLLPHTKMVVMTYPHQINSTDLQALKSWGVDLLRICIVKGDLVPAIELLEAAEKVRLDVSVNFTHTSKYNEQELDAVVHKIIEYGPKIVYFADSNGSMTPQNITAIFERFTRQYPIPFGFHAHDNLGLAQANAMAAIASGAQYIDCSLAGLGKGIGNLRSEFFIAYLLTQHLTRYQLEPLLKATNYVRQTFNTEKDVIELADFIRGISDPAG